jgi:hypothetical protein
MDTPSLRIVRGAPTDDELAAVTAVLAVLAAAQRTAQRAPGPERGRPAAPPPPRRRPAPIVTSWQHGCLRNP